MAMPGAIVDRAGAEVPAVEVAANEQDRRLGIAARNLGDDIARLAAFGRWLTRVRCIDDRLARLRMRISCSESGIESAPAGIGSRRR